MRVAEVMTTPVVSVAPGASIKQAVQLLAEHNITALPVIDDRGELLGLVSESDVLLEMFVPEQRAPGSPVHVSAGPATVRVSDLMSRQVVTISAHADLADAVDLMVGTVAKSLPVTDHNTVVGMLSRRDLIAVLARRDDLIASAVDDLVRTAGYDWVTEVDDGVVTMEGPRAEAEVGVAKVLVGRVLGVVGVYFPAQRQRE